MVQRWSDDAVASWTGPRPSLQHWRGQAAKFCAWGKRGRAVHVTISPGIRTTGCSPLWVAA